MSAGVSIHSPTLTASKKELRHTDKLILYLTKHKNKLKHILTC